MIPPPVPGCQGQPMMTIVMKDCAPSGMRVVIIAAARRGDPCSRREAQVVRMIPPPVVGQQGRPLVTYNNASSPTASRQVGG